MMEPSITSLAILGFVLFATLWLYRINRAMKAVPPAAHSLSPRRWTRNDIRAAYDQVKRTPIDFRKHLPPKVGRRYIIVGGSGHIGGEIAAQLMQRGDPPESIRIVDFRPPGRPDAFSSSGGKCDFAKADITSSGSLKEAFSRPWHPLVADFPVTVFHTAAAIRPSERSPLVYDRCQRVNVGGTANVIDAARNAGAKIFIFTSSASVAMRPVKFWIWPWQSEPLDYVQHYDESDFDAPLRPHEGFFGNYGVSKATAERLVGGANEESFRTGILRPGNAVYGQMGDQLVSSVLQQGTVVTWFRHVIHNFISGRNVALAHLQLEAALARPEMPRCAGRPLNVSDPNPPVAFGDLYEAIRETAVTPVSVVCPPPVLLLIVAHLIENWCLLLAHMPFLTKVPVLREPSQPLALLQPAVFTASSHSIVDGSAARRSVEDGGIDYRGVCTTLEGFCELILDWNREKGLNCEPGDGRDRPLVRRGEAE